LRSLAEIVVIFILIIANGVFAMAEMAVVSARKVRLRQRAESGDKKAQTALELARSPGRFLSTVQVGISLIGALTGAIGGATIASELAVLIERVPLLASYSKTIAVGIVVLGITYTTLVIGELFPKQIALSNANKVASIVAGPMVFLSKVTAPIVAILNASTKLLMGVLRVKPSSEPPVTEDEVRIMIRQGTQVGIFEPIEEEMVGQVFRLSDKRASALITPRSEIVWLDLDDGPDSVHRKMMDSNYSRFPVADGSLDEIKGVVEAKDLLIQTLAHESLDLESVLQPALFVPESIPVFEVLDRFKQTRSQFALVIDEYGILQGLVTVNDVLEAIVGDIPDEDEHLDLEIVERDDGSWLIDGMVPIDEFSEHFEITIPQRQASAYQTLGGYVMMVVGHIPSAGESFERHGLRFEVVDMDGLRVDKVLVEPVG
jgi:putative hemolysin